MNKETIKGDPLSVSLEYYNFLFENTDQGFALLEKVPNHGGQNSDYRYMQVNPAFKRHSGLTDVVGKTILELMPSMAVRVFKLCDSVVSSGQKVAFEEYVSELAIWFAVEVFPTGVPGTLAFLFNNITERKCVETKLEESEQRKTFLLKLSDALRHVADPVEVQTITCQLLGEHLNANQVHYGETSGDMVIIHQGWGNGLPPMIGSFRQQDFGKRLHEGYRAGNIQVSHDIHTDPGITASERSVISGSGFNAYVAVPLIKNGLWVGTLAVHSKMPRTWKQSEIALVQETAERTWDALERARAEKTLRESEIQLRTFVSNSADMIYRMSPDWKFMQSLSGNSFLIKPNQPTGDWLEIYIPKQEQARVIEAVEAAIREKKKFELEHKVFKLDGSIGWTFSRAVPLFDEQENIKEWLGAASDITLRKTAEEQLQHFSARLEQEVNDRTAQLKESRDQLQSVLDTSLMQISIMEAVRDSNGQVNDLEVKLVNKEHERVLGRTDLVGKHFVKEYPGMKQSVLFDLIVKTIETTKPHQAEYFYPYEDFNRWYACMFVKLHDGVVAVNIDITDRKTADEERFKNYLLLQQAENLAQMGSWDYDLQSGRFIWSEGMYRLFNLNKETKVVPDTYLQFATEIGRAAAERFTMHLKNGGEDFADTLEVLVENRTKTLQLKSTLIRDNDGLPSKVLGVALDVTDRLAVEEKIRNLEAEQQLEIFRVSLSTVEEERHRISESLHNGLGQLLFSIKFKFMQLSQSMAEKQFEESKIFTGKLLTSAIDQTRRISYELMPTVLENFGLVAAIEDICQQSHGDVDCFYVIEGLDERMDKYLELVVYRTVQELVTNVVKHAKATAVRIDLKADATEITIQVSDNGCGMDRSKGGRHGIGLASIRSKIKLLNGELTIVSDAASGTKIKIVIPKPKVS